MALEAQLSTGPSRRAGFLTAKNILTLVVILGCGALIAGVAWYALATQRHGADIGDGGFLSQEPCGPPCFLHITPGVTGSGDAVNTLHAQPFAASCGETTTVINCQDVVQIGFQNDMVNMISFKPSARITTADTLSKYGPPDRVFVFISS